MSEIPKDKGKSKKEHLLVAETLKSIPALRKLVIRYDEPKKVYEPEKVTLSGSIFAPADFIAKRKADYEVNQVHVVYSKTQGKIKVVCNEKTKFPATITGTLKINPNLADFNFNGKNELELQALIKLIRFNRWLFQNDEDHKRIVDLLLKFKAEVTQSIVKNNDQRGNIEENFVQQINGGTLNPLSFNASASIYLGTEPVVFKTDIVCEIRSAKVSFWFESIEFDQLKDEQAEVLIKGEIEKLKEYVCIEE